MGSCHMATRIGYDTLNREVVLIKGGGDGAVKGAVIRGRYGAEAFWLACFAAISDHENSRSRAVTSGSRHVVFLPQRDS